MSAPTSFSRIATIAAAALAPARLTKFAGVPWLSGQIKKSAKSPAHRAQEII